MQTSVMKTLRRTRAIPAIALLSILAVASACDRRREEPVEPSDTAQTSAPAASGEQPAVVRANDQQTMDRTPPDPCAGLMDQALQDCRSQNLEASRNAADSKDQVTEP